MNISAASAREGFGQLQSRGPSGRGPGGPGGSPEKAKSALDDLSSNFDTIDTDSDGTLSSAELDTYATAQGIEQPKNAPSNLTREKISELKGKIEEFERRGGPPPGENGRPPRPSGPPPAQSASVEQSSEDFLRSFLEQEQEEESTSLSLSVEQEKGFSAYSRISSGFSLNSSESIFA
jgi:hypothetical protein